MTAYKLLAAVILTYLFGAFVAADFDAREWGGVWRFTVAAGAVMAAVIATEE
jgi:hypothetical protein